LGFSLTPFLDKSMSGSKNTIWIRVHLQAMFHCEQQGCRVPGFWHPDDARLKKSGSESITHCAEVAFLCGYSYQILYGLVWCMMEMPMNGLNQYSFFEKGTDEIW
jgi:hypothetical protein